MGTLVVLLALLAPAANAADLEVGENKTYATILEASEVVEDGDVLRIYAPHTESGAFTVKNMSVTLVGIGNASEIVLTSTHKEGFLYAREDSSVSLANLTISGGGSRRALQVRDGGAMYLDEVRVIDGKSRNGPLLFVREGGVAEIADSYFSGGAGKFGGLIYVSSSGQLLVTGSILEGGEVTVNGSDNSGYGGAVHCRSSATCTFRETTFRHNEAERSGGAIYARRVASLVVEDSRFEENSTEAVGGAVYLSDVVSGWLVRSAFCSNEALDDGGGVISRYSDDVQVHNNLFFRNSSGDRGGGMRSLEGQALWSHNVFWENESTGNGHAMESRDSDVFTSHNIVVGNDRIAGGSGVDAVWTVGGSFSMTWTLLYGNPNGDFNGTLDATNLQAEPELQGSTRECGFEFFKPTWQGNLFDAGSDAFEAADLDGSTADLGLFGGPHAPAESWIDADADGVPALWDCDDSDPERAPDQEESCDGVDNDCNGEIDDGIDDMPLWYFDADGDGYGSLEVPPQAACVAPSEQHTLKGGDCDDTNQQVHPGAEEQCDRVDHNCNGEIDDGVPTSTWYPDEDGDGYGVDDGAIEACGQPDGYAAQDGDCDDSDAAIHPGATEIVGNDVDEDCDGTAQQVDEPEPPEESDRRMPAELDTGSEAAALAAGCSCTSGGGPSGLWVLALGALAGRRRR